MSIPTLVFKTPLEPLPDHPLFISLDHPKRLSCSVQDYRLLSQRFAQRLRKAGFQDGNRVMLAAENSVYVPVIFMGTLMAGGVFVGVQRANSVYDVVKKYRYADPHVVLLSEDNIDRAGEIGANSSGFKPSIYLFDDNLIAGQHNGSTTHWSDLLTDAETAKDFQWPVFKTREEADQTASLISTSGTSGHPKAVELTHYQLVASTLQGAMYQSSVMRPEMMAALRSKPGLALMALTQILGQLSVCILYPMLHAPAFITSRRDFTSVQNFIIELQLPMVIVHPTFLIALMKDDAMRARIPKMNSLKMIMLTGGPVSESVCMQFIRLWQKLIGQYLVIRITYGMTELGGGTVTRTIGMPHRPLADDLLPNNEFKIMDLSGSQEVNQQQEGEVWWRGPNRASGYWQDPESTAAYFKEDGWAKTGDIGLVNSDGVLVVTGRVKDLIGTGPNAKSPFELEEVLLTHSDITEAVVCKIPDESRTDQYRVRAYIINREGSSLNADAILEYLRSQAPHLPQLDGGVSFPSFIPIVSNNKPEREVLVARDPELRGNKMM